MYLELFKLQDELDGMATLWNSHTIRHVTDRVPSGKPNVMYCVPALYNSRDCAVQIPMEEVQVCRDECTFRDIFPFDEDVYELSMNIMRDNNWTFPNNMLKCAELYLNLRQKVRALL